MIASLDLKYYKNDNISEDEYEKIYAFHVNNGILFQVESVLSCYSNEYYMIYEHYNALQNLNHVFVHLPADRTQLTSSIGRFFFIEFKRFDLKSNLHLFFKF